jgi:hypothetical protein
MAASIGSSAVAASSSARRGHCAHCPGQREKRSLSGKDRFAASRRDDQAEQVAEGVDHAGYAEPGEQENQRVTEREVVVDGTEQHDDQGQCEQQPAARRHDEDAALAEAQRCCSVAAPAKKKLLKRPARFTAQGMATLRSSG